MKEKHTIGNLKKRGQKKNKTKPVSKKINIPEMLKRFASLARYSCTIFRMSAKLTVLILSLHSDNVKKESRSTDKRSKHT